MTAPIPEFGIPDSEAEYKLRPGGYAVIFNAAGEVAVVSTPKGLFLPGGGQGVAESPEEAAVREAREECGLRISLGDFIGVADELVFAVEESRHYRKRCAFFLAEIIEQVGAGESDHELIWLAPEIAAERLRHESQRWAVSAAGRITRR
jgi:8-oxo-dGTP pyrophosphatase MutT (NUDIX family)